MVKYTYDLKLKVVKEYVTDYRIAGLDALRPKRKKRLSTISIICKRKSQKYQN